jgi:thiol:disulfide interchange protein
MRTSNPRKFLALATLAALMAAPLRGAPEYPTMGPDIYDVHADGTEQIAAALGRAAAEHKRVIVVFGANWCIWCRRLHSTLETDPTVSTILNDRFVLVDVDVNRRNGAPRNADAVARYGNPTELGLPVLVVLDSNGSRLHTEDSGDLEEADGHSPRKIAEFLTLWQPAAK